MLHTPTLLALNILVTATLAVCLGLVARRDRPDGLFYWAAALVAHTLGYVLYALRGQISDGLSIVLANALVASVFSLMIEGVCQFQQRKAARFWVWAPVLVVAVSFALLLHNTLARVVLFAAVLFVQFAHLGTIMSRQWGSTPGRGKYFVVGGFGLFAVALGIRAMSVLLGAVDMKSITDTNPMQALLFSMATVAMVLANFGMVVMTKERADERNRELALHDELTGMNNRRYIQQTLTEHIAQALRARRPLSVLMLDIDHFKRVNDTYGHLSGDKVLHDMSAIIRDRLRAQDVVGRWGGEEFIAVLPDTDVTGAMMLAEQLRVAVERAGFRSLDGQSLALTISIGVHALGTTYEDEHDDMIGAADRALYRAKDKGRNRVERL